MPVDQIGLFDFVTNITIAVIIPTAFNKLSVILNINSEHKLMCDWSA
jgi:hypothetical protein